MSTPLAVAVFVGLPLLLFAVISLVVWAGCEVGAARRAAQRANDEDGQGAAVGTSGAWWGVPDETPASR